MKQHIGDLAIFGGRPSFAEALHVGRPTLGDRERLLARINDVLDRRWFTNNGPLVTEFERRLAELLGVPHCVATCNGTVALELVIRACALKGEVIVPAFTFVATAHALQWQGIAPIFCDIDERTRTLDPARVVDAITPRTTGIIGVHLWGHACDVERLQSVADAHNLTLLFDAAHALGCTYKGRAIGNFGTAEVFSFHATKFVSTFEGGAITTHDAALAKRLRLMKNFGFGGYDEVVYVGTNGKMNEIAAAMGLTSLESIQEFVNANRTNFEAYRRGLTGIAGLTMLMGRRRERTNYQYLVVDIDPSSFGMTRDMFHQVLWAENVLARRYFYPGCHRMEPYRSMRPPYQWALTVTERMAERTITLPTGAAATPEQVKDVCTLIRFAATHARDIAHRLAKSAAESVA